MTSLLECQQSINVIGMKQLSLLKVNMQMTTKLQCGDNLEFMKTLDSESIDLIYCDILYGTGRNFGDYQDLKPDRGIIQEHYFPRLIEMKRILKDTGSIYLQMDWRVNHWLRCIMDDIFGYYNFRNEIIWCYGAGDVNAKNRFCRVSDHILFYSKSENNIFNIQKDEKSAKVKDWWRIFSFGEKTFNKKWFDEHEDEFVYSTQKPKALLERIIKTSSNEGDIVADFYLGSGTTAVVCKELNRNFIGCDINLKSIEITKQRIGELNDN
jgi:site-specific DNA-methyltransferase (adenine-specific)